MTSESRVSVMFTPKPVRDSDSHQPLHLVGSRHMTACTLCKSHVLHSTRCLAFVFRCHVVFPCPCMSCASKP